MKMLVHVHARMHVPWPLHELHFRGFALSLPPLPLHVSQMTFLVLANLVVLPLYSSSSVTSYSCSSFGPFRGPRRLGPAPPPIPGMPPPPIPMPNICCRISSRSGSGPAPPLKADMPWVSYKCRLSSSERMSYACCTDLNLASASDRSDSATLSGCEESAALWYAFLISTFEAPLSMFRISSNYQSEDCSNIQRYGLTIEIFFFHFDAAHDVYKSGLQGLIFVFNPDLFSSRLPSPRSRQGGLESDEIWSNSVEYCKKLICTVQTFLQGQLPAALREDLISSFSSSPLPVNHTCRRT